jgi:alpha-ketoglutarate-dependent taurine dioxygenase
MAPPETNRFLWHNLSEEQLRASSTLSLPFSHALTPEGQSQALTALYQYGILLVTNTPIHDHGAGVAALASALGGGAVKENDAYTATSRDDSSSSASVLAQYLAGGLEVSLPRGTDGPLRTLYGTVWSTTSAGQAGHGGSVADSAYGHQGLPLHTDMTYMRDPPGLQIFTMIQPARRGGESIFGDGFAAAERLRRESSSAFDVLCQTVRTYRCIDHDTGWHLQARTPILSLCDNHSGVVTAIRHNDLDRLPDLPPPDEDNVDAFYEALEEAHAAWDSILASDDIRLVVRLNPGDTIVVANQV